MWFLKNYKSESECHKLKVLVEAGQQDESAVCFISKKRDLKERVVQDRTVGELIVTDR
jgi:hypothetical protein